MKQKELRERLAQADAMKIWVFTPSNFSVLFGGVERNYLRVMLHRLVESGALVRAARGVYVNPTAKNLPDDPRESLVPYLRPREFSYVSLESVLSPRSVISQISNALTCMTTGSKGAFTTPWGEIQFTHTQRELGDNLEADMVWNDESPIPTATVARAYKDYELVRRRLDLIDEDTLDDVLEEERQMSHALHA